MTTTTKPLSESMQKMLEKLAEVGGVYPAHHLARRVYGGSITTVNALGARGFTVGDGKQGGCVQITPDGLNEVWSATSDEPLDLAAQVWEQAHKDYERSKRDVRTVIELEKNHALVIENGGQLVHLDSIDPTDGETYEEQPLNIKQATELWLALGEAINAANKYQSTKDGA